MPPLKDMCNTSKVHSRGLRLWLDASSSFPFAKLGIEQRCVCVRVCVCGVHVYVYRGSCACACESV